ncbi:Nuclear cap-binding protein subunit 1 [Cyanidiococcus yangmingshanensis]|uniref:Nuclear cap-binding protein subunit 1 n=1 Tax=Cyanidiococcus yangmingshanensis TaxID=2690220 RepID=A0A7J7IQ10_9RHOD|nr:Nuclear cap-binding protein subunit 1 [Cyanidiococcus yangmingshanensis]
MTGQAQAGRQRYAARSWQLVTSRVARLGDQYLLQLSADHKAVAEFYGDYERKARQQWYDAGADQDMQIVPPLPTLEEVREAVQQYAAEINRRASQSGLDSGDQTGDSSEPATPQGHREKRVRLEASEQPATSAAELLRFLEASSPEAWIGSVAFQVALWARALRASPAPILMDAIACEEDYMHRAQMGVFATGEAPLVPPNPLLPVLVRCGTELSYKSDIFALFLALLVYPDRSDEAESGTNPDMITRLDSFCQRLARQVAETVLGLFCGALRHMTTGAPLAEELLMVSTASKAQATATTTSFRNLPPVLQARRTLRFLAELANAHLIDSEWFVRHILHDLLTETALFGADHDKAPLSRSQALVELALEGLLHCGREAERVAADQVDAILHAAERFAGTSRSPESVTRECACMERLFSPVKTGSNTSMSTMEPSSASVHVARRLHELLAGCRQLRARAWHSTLLPQYYLLFWDTHIRKAGLRLSLNTPSVPRHSVDARYPVPSMRLHITKVELLSVASALGTNRDVGSPEIEPAETEPGSMHGSIPFMERFLAVERLTDMLDAFLADRHLCVRMLRRPTPGLSSTDHQVVLVETLLNGMLELPRSRNPLLFYAAVLVELCRGGDPQTAIYLLQAVEALIREARRLDTEVMDRIAAWLAFHLSHFQWEWNWDAWIPLLSDVHSAALITSMLEYAVRLSYRERIQEAIPSEFHRLLVPRPEPCWDFITVRPNEHAGAPLESVPEASRSGTGETSRGVDLRRCTVSERARTERTTSRCLSPFYASWWS